MSLDTGEFVAIYNRDTMNNMTACNKLAKWDDRKSEHCGIRHGRNWVYLTLPCWSYIQSIMLEDHRALVACDH